MSHKLVDLIVWDDPANTSLSAIIDEMETCANQDNLSIDLLSSEIP